MAVENDGAFFPTEAIISSKARKHYRVPVRSQHWQLRSLISAEKQNIVYFPGGKASHFVQRLNTVTRECETIKLLSFAPRCLVAEHGWLCCGSESGDFVAIRLENSGPGGDGPETGERAEPSRLGSGDEADLAAAREQSDDTDLGDNGTSRSTPASAVDSDPQMPLGLGPTSSSEELLTLIAQTQCSPNKPTLAKSMKLAKERVNCVTLWFPPTDLAADENAYKEPVAVLANNDRTVTLVSLRDFEENDKIGPLEIVTYPDLVNRAVISPDGRIMIAILDDPFLYVHQRVEVPAASRQDGDPRYKWELKQSLLLKSQRKDDKTDSRGSFAACFSASGLHLAVGTQHGTISIFDSALLTQSAINPLITTFTSSRPDNPAGAVRDMAFCPGPYDLLAWSEDRGHVGVADIRSNFAVRQIVDINDDTGIEHISVLDRHSVDPRLIQGREIDLVNHPLTAAEMQILEAIQYDRRRRDRGTSSRETEIYPPLYRPRDAPPLPDSAEDRARRLPDSLRFPYRASANDGDSPRPQNGRDAGRGAGAEERSGILAFSELRNRLRERERNAARDWREGPRVQAGTSLRRFEPRWMGRSNDQSAALRELRDQRLRPDPNYENVLEILFARDAPGSDNSTNSNNNNNNNNSNGNNDNSNNNDADDTSLLVPLVNQVVNRWEESAIRGTLTPDHGVFEGPPSPDNTAGVAWSQDGRILFIGAQNGIYELKVNTHSRKFHPSISMR